MTTKYPYAKPNHRLDEYPIHGRDGNILQDMHNAYNGVSLRGAASAGTENARSLNGNKNNCNHSQESTFSCSPPSTDVPVGFPDKRGTRELFMNGVGHHASLHMMELRQWSLFELRDYLKTHVPKWVDKNDVDWTAPDCTIGILRYNDTGQFAGFVPCGSWTCPVCAAAKKMKLERGVADVFGDKKCCFLTLTVNPNKFDDRLITKAFARLRASLLRYGYFDRKKEHQYVWVKEFTPPSHEYMDAFGNSRVTVGHVRHIHMLTNFYVPQTIQYKTEICRVVRTTTLSALWKKATDGTSDQIKMIRKTHTHGAIRASYMFKYIDKSCSGEAAEHDFQRYERRYGKSILLFRMKPESTHTCFLQLLKRFGGVPPVVGLRSAG